MTAAKKPTLKRIECIKAYRKAYQMADKYKAWLKAYRKSDKYKAYMKAYRETIDIYWNKREKRRAEEFEKMHDKEAKR